MASLVRIKARIQQIAEGNRKNLKLSDLQWVADHLKANGYTVHQKTAPHGTLFQIGVHTFSVCTHISGSSQIKKCYVDEFVKAMIQLGLYED